MARRPRAAAVLVTAAAACLLAACSSPGQPLPTSPPPSSSTSSVPTQAPTTTSQTDLTPIPVDNPLDATQYLKHTCRLLTDNQVTRLGGKPASAERDTSQATSGIPSSCAWDAAESAASFSVSFNTKYSTGLARLKRGQQTYLTFDVFKPSKVSGYPAFITRNKGGSANGTCGIDVGVNNHVVLTALVQLSTVSPCQGVKNVAEAAIETLEGGQ